MAQQNQQQEAITINMADLTVSANAPAASKKKQDTLFGPNIGIVARGPEWTESREKVIDELTPEVVKAWIAKSKEVSRHSCVHSILGRGLPDCALAHTILFPSGDRFPFRPVAPAPIPFLSSCCWT